MASTLYVRALKQRFRARMEHGKCGVVPALRSPESHHVSSFLCLVHSSPTDLPVIPGPFFQPSELSLGVTSSQRSALAINE